MESENERVTVGMHLGRQDQMMLKRRILIST